VGRRLVAMLVAAIAALGLAAWPRGLLTDAVAGDPKIADTLFKSGKQALGKGDSEGAVSYFKKALEENPDLIEACWWRASAQEKGGDKAAALASYREYVTLFEGKGPAASKEEQRLKGLADKSIAQLAAGEAEFRKLEDGYVAALLTFAKDNFVRDPGVSRRAVEALLAVRPDHEEATKLLEKLGGGTDKADDASAADAPGPATGPFKDVKEWRDLVAEQVFTSKEKIRYEGGTMIFDTKDGAVVGARETFEVGATYAYETELRVNEVHDRGWLTGVCFACTGDKNADSFLCAYLNAGGVSLLRASSPTAQEEVAERPLAGVDPKAWHRLGVIVKGPAVEVWFDGKQVLTWREPSAKDLTGQFAIFQQRCTTERRLFRLGKVEP